MSHLDFSLSKGHDCLTYTISETAHYTSGTPLIPISSMHFTSLLHILYLWPVFRGAEAKITLTATYFVLMRSTVTVWSIHCTVLKMVVHTTRLLKECSVKRQGHGAEAQHHFWWNSNTMSGKTPQSSDGRVMTCASNRNCTSTPCRHQVFFEFLSIAKSSWRKCEGICLTVKTQESKSWNKSMTPSRSEKVQKNGSMRKQARWWHRPNLFEMLWQDSGKLCINTCQLFSLNWSKVVKTSGPKSLQWC